MDANGPNAQQIQYWNETAGPKWVALQTLIDDQIRPLGSIAMERAALRPGERVLDVGCGCGDTSVGLARRVAPNGTVTGVDISAVMLERARRLAEERKVSARFEHADAQTHTFAPASVDVIFSRFGVMFFSDPPAAFANLRKAVRPGGRLTFICWQSLADNPWMLVPLGAALQHMPPPPMPAPDAPGPFAFADSGRVRGILSTAGFDDVQFEDVRETLRLGAGMGTAETAEFLIQMGPAAAVLREANDPALVPRVAAAVSESLKPYVTADGIRLQSACWIVTARA